MPSTGSHVAGSTARSVQPSEVLEWKQALAKTHGFSTQDSFELLSLFLDAYGLPARDQATAGRYLLVDISFKDMEREIRDLLGRALENIRTDSPRGDLEDALREDVAIPAGLTIENRPDWETEYHGIDLNFQKRLALGEALAHLAYLRKRGEVAARSHRAAERDEGHDPPMKQRLERPHQAEVLGGLVDPAPATHARGVDEDDVSLAEHEQEFCRSEQRATDACHRAPQAGGRPARRP